ncbi:glycosyltransferase [Lactococcus lactis]|uniref:glycosyltransferase n=1 Tax=Lactococcus lactis TaxID=1358 RepID=UPI003569C9BD
MEKYQISVVIPTYNREELLIETLNSLNNQSLSKKNFEIVIVDDGSQVPPNKIIDSFSKSLNLKLFTQENKGFRAGTARNKGVENSEGEIIVFVDSGVALAYDTLETHLKLHEKSLLPTAFLGYMFGFDELNQNKEKIESLQVNGLNINEKLKEIDIETLGDRRESSFSLNGENLLSWENPWLIFWTGHLSLPRKEFLSLGGFEESFNGWGYEDIDFGLNWYLAGFNIEFSRSLVALHLPHEKVKQSIPEDKRKGYSNLRKRKLYDKHRLEAIRLWMEEPTEKVEFLSRQKGIGHSRICLAGEDLDWCGGQTIQYSLPLTTKSVLRKNQTGELCVSSSYQMDIKQLRLSFSDLFSWNYDGNYFDYVVAGIRIFYEKFNIFPSGILNISSQIPPQSGLSSSAALLVSIIDELDFQYGTGLSDAEKVEFSYQAETRYVGSTVGKMDYFASFVNGIFIFDSRDNSITRVASEFMKELSVYLVYSGKHSSCKIINPLKMQRYEDKEKHFLAYKDIGLIEIKEYQSNIGLQKTFELVNNFQMLMRDELLVSTLEIDVLIKKLIGLGADAAKITGCGLGGYVFALVKNDGGDKFEHELKEQSIEYIVCKGGETNA